MNFLKTFLVLLISLFLFQGVVTVVKAIDTVTKNETNKSIIDLMNVYKPEKVPGKEIITNENQNPQITTLRLLGLIADYIIYFSGTLATIGVIVGGARYMFSFGGDGKESAKKTLIWSLVGLVVVMLSYAIVHNVIRLILLFSEETP